MFKGKLIGVLEVPEARRWHTPFFCRLDHTCEVCLGHLLDPAGSLLARFFLHFRREGTSCVEVLPRRASRKDVQNEPNSEI